MVKKSTTSEIKNTTSDKFSKKVSSVLTKDVLKKDRDREVIAERYGLSGARPKTLEAIGKNLGVTRERVRQIEKTALAKIKKAVPDKNSVDSLHKSVEEKMNSFGGIVNEERLVSAFIPTKKQDLREINSFIFLLHLDERITRHGENKETRAYWTLSNSDTKRLHELSGKINKLFDSKRKVMNIESIAKATGDSVEIVESLLWTKKNVLQTDDKKWGLITWREVNPRSIKDKTYIIMREHKSPLHYGEITEKILNHRLQKRPVTKQAVHNELIRDDRFVLIGRGIYALREWGYKPGVVEDVIREILEEEGRPMHKNEIIEHVKKHRIVKETTVILNLQKDTFKRVSRATYTLAD